MVEEKDSQPCSWYIETQGAEFFFLLAPGAINSGKAN